MATISGTGAQVADLGEVIEDLAIVHLTHTGSRNFIVRNYNDALEEQDLLVNQIGDYDGRVVINLRDDEDTQYFEVEADGAWTIEVLPLEAVRWWDGGELHGVGDDVAAYTGAAGVMQYAFVGEGNFIVRAIGDRIDLLVNEIDSIEGQVIMGQGPQLIIVAGHGGEWWLRV